MSTNTIKQTDVIKMAAKEWREMSKDEKLLYCVRARKNQEEKKFIKKHLQNRALSVKTSKMKKTRKSIYIDVSERNFIK